MMEAFARCKELEQRAEAVTANDPLSASRIYLDVAERYLELSRTASSVDETELVEKAKALFEKSQALEKKAEAKDQSSAIRVIDDHQFMTVKPNPTFKDIGGLDDLKEEIRLKIIEPLRHPDIFEYYGKRAGGGILMYGPPGCGKSLIAEATAGEAEVAFFNVKTSDLKSKFVGETEKNIARLFEQARQSQPAIIFFDEFESLASERTNSQGHERSALSQLLIEMNGVGTKDQKILLLAATNEPWLIDVAMRREGRFGATIFVPAPDLKARFEIFKHHLHNKPIADDVNLYKLAGLTKNFSGADISAAVEAATDIALKECLKTKKARKITQADFNAVLKKREPSISIWYKQARLKLEKSGSCEFFKELAAECDRFLAKNSISAYRGEDLPGADSIPAS
ncbi:ATP-binding protein [Candidatus Woesearchaeota archaeon]|nr:ATP-binding protein [Candidatus Woesearchaeota archaeon]